MNIFDTLHPEGSLTDNLYPNIKKQNIPSKSIRTDKLDDNVLSLIGSLKPSGTDTSTNILAFTSNKGIYVATDNGHWYYWNGSAYTNGGVYQASVGYDDIYTITKQSRIDFINGYTIKTAYNIGDEVNLTPSADSLYRYAIVDCNANDIIILNGSGGFNPRLYAFLDNANKLLEVADVNKSANNLILIAPKNTSKLVINDNVKNGICWLGFLKYNYDNILNNVGYDYTNQSFKCQIDTGGSIGTVVNLVSGSAEGYKHNIIYCNANDKFLITGTGGFNPRLWCFIDNDNKILSVSNANERVDKLILTAHKNANILICNFSINNDSSIIKITDYSNIKLKLDIDKINQNEKISINQTLLTTPDNNILSYVNGLKLTEDLDNYIIDFTKSGDLMVHVSTFTIINDIVYCTYYANTTTAAEDPTHHIARFAYCPLNDVNNKIYIDLQSVGDTFDGKTVNAIYDTILLHKDNETLYLMWTAQLNGIYTRLYRTYNIATGTLSNISYNYFYVNNTGGIFNTTNMINALNTNKIEHKPITIDIGIMQKLSSRIENGITYYYTGCYANEFNCIIKSSDLINWYYVASPNFYNQSQFENSTYVIGDKVYYFFRQKINNNAGVLTYYDIINDRWEKPVYINDCQSRSDFLYVNGELFLIHAPYSRNRLSITRIDLNYLCKSREISIALVNDYFYPYTLYYNNEFYMSFTKSRQHIYLSKFRLSYSSDTIIANKLKTLFYD